MPHVLQTAWTQDYNTQVLQCLRSSSTSKGQYAPVIGLFEAQAKRGEPLTIVGDGEERIDFTHVNDVVEANMNAMMTNYSGMVVNVGTGVNHSVNEVASYISDNTVNIPERPGEARVTLCDISEAKENIGYEPKVNIGDYVKEVISE